MSKKTCERRDDLSTLKTLNDSTKFCKLSEERKKKLLFENQIECEWLKTEEAAHFLSVTPNAVRIMVHRGQIRAYKFGRRLRFKLDDCRALFKLKGVN